MFEIFTRGLFKEEELIPDFHPVTSALFGTVHGLIGPHQNILEEMIVSRRFDHPDTDGR